MDDNLNPRQFGSHVRAALQSEELYDVLDAHPGTHGTTPQQGACHACAVALSSRLPGTEVHAVRSEQGAEHFVVHHQGRYLDSNGSVQPKSLRRRWNGELSYVGRRVASIGPATEQDFEHAESRDESHPVTGRKPSEDIADLLGRRGI